jgi:hypothetical protein
MSNITQNNTNQPSPQDGLDNTGTQGYDSLSDDAYTGAVIPKPTSNDPPENEGEKIIFDLLINEKLAHAIVIKNERNFYLNLDGEDLGRLEVLDNGKIKRFPQPKGANTDDKVYFDPIENKLKTLGILG